MNRVASASVPVYVRLGNALLRSMRACVALPSVLDPFKALWILLCYTVLKQWFMRKFLPDIRSVYGFSLAGSPVSSMLNGIIVYRDVFEPTLSEVIDKLVGDGDVCLDVRANVGYIKVIRLQPNKILRKKLLK